MRANISLAVAAAAMLATGSSLTAESPVESRPEPQAPKRVRKLQRVRQRVSTYVPKVPQTASDRAAIAAAQRKRELRAQARAAAVLAGGWGR